MQVQEIALDKLHPWEDNPRMNDHAVTAVAQSISSFGFNVPILCDQHLPLNLQAGDHLVSLTGGGAGIGNPDE